MPLNMVFEGLKMGLDYNPITKALLPPSRNWLEKHEKNPKRVRKV